MLEEIIREYLCYLGLVKDFLEKQEKQLPQSNNNRKGKLDLIKTKNICSSLRNIKEINKYTTD